MLLTHDSLMVVEWFQSNYMKSNEEKCHLLISRYKHELLRAYIGRSKIWESEKQKLLGIVRDRNFVTIQKTGRKLVRICKFLAIGSRINLMKAFTESQFGFGPLVWMCCDQSCNNRMKEH